MKKRFSKLEFMDHLPAPEILGEELVLIYDQHLNRVSPEFARWSRKFSHRYGVRSGERLKDVAEFPKHLEKLTKLTENLNTRKMKFIVAGGGSVGDFGGFIASIFKRGVPLVHVPTTWLAAIDSSHGGKTALNVSGVKNQIGTFYPAERVLMVRSLLLAQPQERATEAFGELAKIALIDGGSWVQRLATFRGAREEILWRFLKPAIAAKLKIVALDPNEKSGARQILNLGHTVGHVLESALDLPHGTAITEGLLFAVKWSFKRGLLVNQEYQRVANLLDQSLALTGLKKKPISEKKFTSLLMKDKKKSSSRSLTYIWMKRLGLAVREQVDIDAIVSEAKRQGWVR